MKLNELTVTEAIKRLRTKKFSCLDLTKACLKRIKEVDGKIKAFITVCEQEALKSAAEKDLFIKESGFPKDKLLFGIPFSMKDVYCTKGVRTTAGSKVLGNYIPVYNATVYQKLLDAGAILIGKTNCDAWGHGSSTENSDFFVTHNPWDLSRVPGGSSGGSAAEIIADISLFSIGEDTGGSIRLPSSFCSTVGFKVSYGRVSRYGSIAYASSLDTVGPMTKTAEDCALVLKIIAGKDKFDATTSLVEVPDYLALLKSLPKQRKIGIAKEFFSEGIDREVKDIIMAAIKKLESEGFSIAEVSLPTLKYNIAVYYLLACSETSSNLARYDGIRFGNKRIAFGDEAKRRIMLGTYALSTGYYDQYYLKAQKARTLIVQDFEKLFQKCDWLIAPVSPTPPFKIGEKVDDPLAMYLSDIYTLIINVAGVPSLAIPCGFTKDNLPVGMQVIGPQFREDLILQMAYAYQQVTSHHKRKPEI